MILNNKRCSRTVASFLLLTLLTTRSIANQAKAFNVNDKDVNTDYAEPATLPDQLYVDVILNQMPIKQLIAITQQHQQLYISQTTLKELGIALPPSVNQETVSLSSLSAVNIHYQYDVNKLQLQLTVPVKLLTAKPQIFDQADNSSLPIATSSFGLLMNYSAYTTNWQDHPESSLWNEIRLLGLPNSLLTNSMQSQFGEQGNHHIRLDTTWSYDMPEKMLNFSVGDFITKSVDWSRSTRVGGIQLSKDFSLQPYYTTTPLASFVGNAALPSRVDLYINGVKNSSQQVSPGQFELQGFPITNGVGQVTMDINDINGQSHTVSFDLYGTSQLLRQGLVDWSTELGFVRKNWGISSFDYAKQPMMDATIRYGITNSWSIESHGEIDKNVQLLGIGSINLLPFQLGVINSSFSQSQQQLDQQQSGSQWQVGYQWNNNRYNLSAAILRRDKNYHDVASEYDSDLTSEQAQAFAGINTQLGQWSTGYVEQKTAAQGTTQYLSLNWSEQFVHLGSFYVSLNRQINQQTNDSINLSWSMPLNDRTYINSTITNNQGKTNLSVNATKNNSRLGGLGWRIQGSSNDFSQHNFQGELRYTNQYGDFGLGAGYWLDDEGNSITSYASANGGILFMDKQFFAMRSADDAFALVSTKGMADVPVKLENRLVGYTDNKGYFLINDLNAYQHNLVAIDPLNLPLDVAIGTTVFDIVPSKQSGTIVNFDLYQQKSLQLSLKFANGNYLPVGSAVWLTDKSVNDPQQLQQTPELTQVGYDGIVYLANPAVNHLLVINTGQQHYCQVKLTSILFEQTHESPQVALCQ